MQNLTLDAVVDRLESRGYVVRKSGGVYRSQCPAHDGKDLNLAFTLGNKGQVVFTCHSHGCKFEEIMETLGIEKPNNNHQPLKAAFGKKVHATFEKAITAAAFSAKRRGQPPDKIYRYDNVDGSENLFVLRWNAVKDKGKEVRPITKVTDNCYICGESTEGALPIYNLPKIAALFRESTVRIFITEGEKAADCATSLGLLATTSAFGSNSADKADWAVLDRLALKHNKKPEIVILPDNDSPGEKYAETLVGTLMQFKSQPVVKVVSLADYAAITGLDSFPKGGDIVDLCELLDSKTDTEIVQMIEAMIRRTPAETEVVEENAVYPWRPFPVELLPETVSRFIFEVAAANGCDPAGAAIATLVVLATAIGNSRRLRLKRGWVFPAILWGMLIARKGAIKSWAMSPAVKPLNARQEEYQARYKTERDEYDRRKAEYARLSPKQRRETTFDLKEPILRRIISNDSTDQKMVKNCAENQRGFCIFCDELTTLLKGIGQYCKDGKGGNGQSIFNSLFNGEGIESERIGESRYAPHAFVGILGGIQPGMARKCFDQEAFESGFASRFIPVAPPLRVATWSDAVIGEETEEAYCRLVFAILKLEMEAVFGPAEVSEWNADDGNAISATSGPPVSCRPVLIETAPEALAVYKDFYNRTADEMLALEDDNIRGSYEKLRTYAARFALVIHVTRAIEQYLFLKRNVDPSVAPWNHSEPRINELECDVESMQIAVALADWFKYEVRRVYSTWGGLADETPTPKGDPLQQKIVEFIEQKRLPTSVSELKRRFRNDKKAISDAIQSLLGQGVLEPVLSEKSGPGRRSEQYQLKM